jgi:flagellar basal body rod protein FlgB
MNLQPLIADNIDELLAKIVEFTKARRDTLVQNIQNVHTIKFSPKDLPISEFCEVLNYALAEHIQSRRLVLRDTQNIEFGLNGSMKTTPINDEHAKKLLKKNPDKYLGLQLKKLLETSLNKKVAEELLKQKHQVIQISKERITKKPKRLPIHWDKTQF